MYLSNITIHRIILSTWIVCTLGFILLTGLVIKDRLRTADFALTVKLQDKIPKKVDDNLVHLIDLGSMEVQTILIALALFFAPVSKKVKGVIAIAYIVGLAITLLGKSFLPQPAPAFSLQRGAAGFAFPSSHVQVAASYPSGHTYRVIFLSSLILGSALVAVRRRAILLVLSLLSIGFSTLVLMGLVLLGKHWVSDIIGGLFLATGLVSASLLLHTSHSK